MFSGSQIYEETGVVSAYPYFPWKVLRHTAVVVSFYTLVLPRGCAGCIDTCGGLGGDEMTDQVLEDLMKDPDI